MSQPSLRLDVIRLGCVDAATATPILGATYLAGRLIVELIGLADALAMYANATGDSDKPIKELQDEAIPAMRSAFEQLQSLFHGYDYSAALDAESRDSEGTLDGVRAGPCRVRSRWRSHRI